MKKILFVVSGTSVIGPKNRRTGNLLPGAIATADIAPYTNAG